MRSQYIFLYPSPLDLAHYTADAFVVWCFDDRFREGEIAFLEHMGVRHRDPESPAGGAKIFFDPEKESDQDFMRRELEKSVRLHGTEKVWLFTHHDCGACGGFARFDNDHDKEISYHGQGHRRAKDFVKKYFSAIEVRTFFVDEKGVIETTDF